MSSSTSSSCFKRLIYPLIAVVLILILTFHFVLYSTHQEFKQSDQEEHGPRNARVIKKPKSRTSNKNHRPRDNENPAKSDDDNTKPTPSPVLAITPKSKKNHHHHDEESTEKEEGDDVFVDDSPVQDVITDATSSPITSLKQLRHSKTEFFVFIEQSTGKYLARPLNTLTSKSKWRERIFRVQLDKKYTTSQTSPSFTVRGHTRLYLTSETNDRVTIDRLWARSFEQWHFDFSSASEDGCVRLRANRNKKYVTVFKGDGSKSLETVTSDKEKAAKWKMYAVLACSKTKPSKSSGGRGGNDDADDDDDIAPDSPEVRCWGPDLSGYEKSRKKSRPGDGNKLPPGGPLRGPLLDSPLHTPTHLLNAKFPLFGSPKPLKSSTPRDPHDHFDTVVIAERTIRNWASMDGMIPIMFSVDPATVEIVQRVNDDVEEHKKQLEKDGCVVADVSQSETDHNKSTKKNYSNVIPRHLQKHRTLISKDFEIQKDYDQPTYRGLFKRALELYPDAPAVMYSNGDILFSPTLAQTIRRVASYFEERRKVQPKLRGWMIVGQRVNSVVPAEFYLRDIAPSGGGDGGEENSKSLKRYFTCSDLKAMKKKIGLVDDDHDDDAAENDIQAAALRRNFSLITMPQWVLDVEDKARNGQLFQGNAEDYFIVSRDMFDWDKIPDFVVGGVAFDNWITGRGVQAALKGEAIMVDAVKTITALHQNDNDDVKTSHKSPKSRYNLDLAARHGGIHDGYTADAPHATERLPDGTVTIYDKHALLFS